MDTVITMENIESAAPPTPRTAAATAARMRAREEAAADLLVSRGWTVATPQGMPWGTSLLAEEQALAS